MKIFSKKIVAVIVLFGFVSAAYVVYKEHKPFQEFFDEIIESISYPIRFARLVTQNPDVSLSVPVKNVRLSEISDTWGAPRPTGRGHNGVDIFAPTGTEIYSATKGFVTRYGTSDLGGNHVFVTGPGGIRYYYAHLSDFADDLQLGQEVTENTVIGYVGNTGNAINTPPHLHFGIYNRGAENPFPLLVERISPD